jgi:hypothetical protein
MPAEKKVSISRSSLLQLSFILGLASLSAMASAARPDQASQKRASPWERTVMDSRLQLPPILRTDMTGAGYQPELIGKVRATKLTVGGEGGIVTNSVGPHMADDGDQTKHRLRPHKGVDIT